MIKQSQSHRRLNKTKIKRAAQRILSSTGQHWAEISILFVGDRKMKKLNTIYRSMPKTTDVLSFPQQRSYESKNSKFKTQNSKLPSPLAASHFSLLTSHFLLGDVVISLPTAKRQAQTAGVTLYDEIYRLLIHGILHLLGYDHEGTAYKAKIMRKKEEEIFNAVKKTA
ncbi:MAG: rRNA maturation RNase YbeY [Nitrospirae bacterium]|nr:rRNA maturation RNase YbeY [Nitrospirota bacterium]